MAERNFEAAMKRLEEIVKSLEEGEMPLGKSLRVFEEGMQLAGYCSGELEAAEKKAQEFGYHTLILSSLIEGETRDVAKVHCAVLKEVCRTGTSAPRGRKGGDSRSVSAWKGKKGPSVDAVRR